MRLRARQLCGAKFRRQHPIGGFIADFCCVEGGLIIELDGGHHATTIKADVRRTAALKRHGYRVLRFWDDDVLQNIDAVLEQIARAVGDPHPRPLPNRARVKKT
jgi:very-short-patch-repair endonuclease